MEASDRSLFFLPLVPTHLSAGHHPLCLFSSQGRKYFFSYQRLSFHTCCEPPLSLFFLSNLTPKVMLRSRVCIFPFYTGSSSSVLTRLSLSPMKLSPNNVPATSHVLFTTQPQATAIPTVSTYIPCTPPSLPPGFSPDLPTEWLNSACTCPFPLT